MKREIFTKADCLIRKIEQLQESLKVSDYHLKKEEFIAMYLDFGTERAFFSIPIEDVQNIIIPHIKKLLADYERQFAEL